MAGRKRKSAGNKKAETADENAEELNGNGVEESSSNNENAATESESQDTDKAETEQPPEKSPKKGKRGRKPAAKNDADKEGDDPKYEVEAVVGDKVVKGTLHYLIHWKGYSADEDTWEPEDTLSCPDLVKKYLASKKKSNKKDDDDDEEAEDEPRKSTSKKTKKHHSDSSNGDGPQKSKKRGRPKGSSKKAADIESGDEDDGAEYEVKNIIEVHYCRNGSREFLVRWKGYSAKEDTWEPEDNLNCPDLIQKFLDKVEEKRNVDSRELRINPTHTDRLSLRTQETGRRLSKRFNGKQRVQYHEAE